MTHETKEIIHLRKLLHERFGLKDFRKGQLAILESVIQKKDAMAVMPTGGGKSLCYQLPAVYFNGIVVVISPLISLMKDQVESLGRLGIEAGAIYSGQSLGEKRDVFNRMKNAENFVLYLSPERVQKDGFANWIRTKKISLFAIDEAHCVSQWGADFREDYYRLKILRELRPEVPILALTATATQEVLFDISRYLGLRNPDRHVYGFYRPNLFCQVNTCANDGEKLALVKKALRQTPEGRVIIYCGTRQNTEDLAASLQAEFPDIGYYHAGLGKKERELTQDHFTSGSTRILVATNAFGMGIDRPDVRLVIHYQIPANIESYYQEMGRAGRDGLPSTCLLLYSKKDKGLHGYFVGLSKANRSVINRKWRALEAVTQFVEGGECRHAGILTYFKDSQRIEICGHCDICDPLSDRGILPLTDLEQERAGSKKKLAKSARAGAKGLMRGSKRDALDLDSPLSKDEELRMEILKTWRKEYADANDIPAFVVFSNKTLRDLAVKNPQNEAELLNVYGLGEQKVERLGSAILAQLRSAEL